MEKRKKYALIVAGGKGVRMGNDLPKQFLPLLGRPVLYHTIQAFTAADREARIILILPGTHTAYAHEIVSYFPHTEITLAEGGETRFHSVQNGLKKVQGPSVVWVHDGVRPLLTEQLIHTCHDQALEKGSAIPVVELQESLRRIQGGKSFAENRAAFRIVQTPQTFLSEILLPAFTQPYDPSFTDEATVVENSGRDLHLVQGETQNIKITRPSDMWMAKQILSQRLNLPLDPGGS